jgi:hypothetical protein
MATSPEDALASEQRPEQALEHAKSEDEETATSHPINSQPYDHEAYT